MSEPEPDPVRLRWARKNPAVYASLVGEGKWKLAPHLRLLCERVQDLHAGRLRRLIVSMPPRSGKTMFLSRFLPGWWLGTRPADRAILVSYQERLVRRWSRAARDDLAYWGPRLWGVGASSRASTAEWDVYNADGRPTGGGLTAVGAGGALTGRGCDLLVADDLVKGTREALSRAALDNAWEWFQGDVLTRLEPGGRALVTMTRWSHEDIVGRLIERQERGGGGEEWAVVNLPALAEENDPLQREPGEALWPARFPVSALEKIKAEVGSRAWESLYQGRPTPLSGGMFKREWLRSYDVIGDVIRIAGYGEATIASLRKFGTCDLATSTRTTADYTAVACWGYHPGWQVLVLLDMVHERIPAPELVPRLRSLVERWDLTTLFVERAGFQLSALAMIRDAQREALPVREIAPSGDKVTRAMPLTAALEGGRLLLPRSAPWLADLQDELLAFPAGGHDDQVDALAYGVIVSAQFKGLAGASGSPTPPGYCPRRRERQPQDARWRIGR